MIHDPRVHALLEALADLGYTVETDWRPNRLEQAAPGRGWVREVVVHDRNLGRSQRPCLSREAQRLSRSGYELRRSDLLDLAALDDHAD